MLRGKSTEKENGGRKYKGEKCRENKMKDRERRKKRNEIRGVWGDKRATEKRRCRRKEEQEDNQEKQRD